MPVLISKPKLNELMRNFDVSENQVRKVLGWMNENVEDYTNLTDLAEAAENEVEGASDMDEELFGEVAFLFESVVDYEGDDDDEGDEEDDDS